MSKLPKKLSKGEEAFAMHCEAYGLKPVREYMAVTGRKFRVDFAFPGDKLIAVEIEGGIWTNGRHSRGAGMREDMRKYNLLASQGWRLFRFSTDMVISGEAIDIVREALA